MAAADRARTFRWLIGLVEEELRRIGGDSLLAEARDEADCHTEACCPWDGIRTEPVDRLQTRLEALSRRLPDEPTEGPVGQDPVRPGAWGQEMNGSGPADAERAETG